jgi:aminopeptidase YwaD
MTKEEGERLLRQADGTISIDSRAQRISSRCYNVIAHNGTDPKNRIALTAHIDSKKGSPGAIDNASGVVVLLLLADLLKEYTGPYRLELVALNGEDYYAVPGQMNYIEKNRNRFDTILFNINIDGAGYIEGDSSFTLFNLPAKTESVIRGIIRQSDGLVEGPPWFQGDHSIFLHNGCPAIAVTSEWIINNHEGQSITHTPQDTPDIVDCSKLIEIAEGITKIILAVCGG